MTQNLNWQLPPGVSSGTQEYFESDVIAEDYDRYFEYTSLFQLDESVVLNELGPSSDDSIVADFGCGTGRLLVALGKKGYAGLGIDLSDKMLEIVRHKANRENLNIQCAKANLVQLDGFRDHCVDHGICLFSTLGMIQGSTNRYRALQHFRRMIKPEGKLVIHVHNYWYNLYDPGGPSWMLKNICQSMLQKGIEAGDRFYPYRGVYNMYLHVFRKREIERLLRQSGFQISKLIPLNPVRMDRLNYPWFLSSLRCNGWIIVCQ